ncbi:MAG: spermidine synthase, partial [Promicromonosporaceae bacterium]|nr:spermidine synthase [Promicromonosporaceae bacterium]
TPAGLTTPEAASAAAAALRPGGIYLANCGDRPPLTEARRELATLRTAFPEVVVIAEPAVLKGRRYGNLVLVGVKAAEDAAPFDLDDATLARRLRTLPVPAQLVREL